MRLVKSTGQPGELAALAHLPREIAGRVSEKDGTDPHSLAGLGHEDDLTDRAALCVVLPEQGDRYAQHATARQIASLTADGCRMGNADKLTGKRFIVA